LDCCIASFGNLLSVHLRYGLHALQVAIATLSIEGFSGFVTSAAVSTATGWSEPVPGRDLHPLKTNAFSRSTWIVGNLPLPDWWNGCPDFELIPPTSAVGVVNTRNGWKEHPHNTPRSQIVMKL
jgi:hypothetical protein